MVCDDWRESNFYALAGVFLTANCLTIVVLLFLNMGKIHMNMKTFLDLMPKKLPNEPPRDPSRQTPFKDELEIEREDEEWVVCYEDIVDIFTMGKIKNDKML